MQLFDAGDILQAMFQVLFSPLGLLLVGIVAARVAIDHFFPPRRRRRGSSGSSPGQGGPYSSRYRTSPPAAIERPRRRYDAEALGDIRDLSADEFEDFVADLFVRRGYEATIVGGDGDHGVDIIVKNPQGERELVQCKRWDRKWIGEPVVRDFYGAFVHDGQAVRGCIVTTSVFSDAAWAWSQGKPIDLIDGKKLAEAVRVVE